MPDVHDSRSRPRQGLLDRLIHFVFDAIEEACTFILERSFLPARAQLDRIYEELELRNHLLRACWPEEHIEAEKDIARRGGYFTEERHQRIVTEIRARHDSLVRSPRQFLEETRAVARRRGWDAEALAEAEAEIRRMRRDLLKRLGRRPKRRIRKPAPGTVRPSP